MASGTGKTLPAHRLSIKDRLSRLTFIAACKLLGPQAEPLIRQNANRWQINIQHNVRFTENELTVEVPPNPGEKFATVTIKSTPEAKQNLGFRCDTCDAVCDHVGAVFSLLLEEKTALGLAVPPAERVPIESLSEEDLVRQALADRELRAREEKMALKSANPDTPWTEYVVTNRLSGKTYRVNLRGFEPGESFCTCPDFRKNTLGTCKHIIRVGTFARRKFTPEKLRRRFRPTRLELHLHYADEVTLRLLVPEKLNEETLKIVAPLRDKAIKNLPDLLKRLKKLQQNDQEVIVSPDAEEYIEQHLARQRLTRLTEKIRQDPENHPLRTSLLRVPLLPYQMDGIAFAVGATRAILADDMGLGKTIQGVGTAEFLAREADVRKTLVICPASLKSQWSNEIRKFCDRDVQLIAGGSEERALQYGNDCFFSICNYEQVLRDITVIERTPWDLIILDEGQRIKNWESKTSRVVKCLRSPFALVLTGTPLENRLDDLYSVVQFVDDRRLGPGFRFFNRHRIVDEKGKVLGYKNLSELREALKPVLLRRTRESVRLELPPRTTEIIRITPTAEQLSSHDGHMRTVASIVRKRFLTEMDLLRLQKELLMCRMVADSTFLEDKQNPPGYSSKLAQLDELIGQLFEEEGRKVILFSEWTTMLDLIEPLLEKRSISFVRLDGSVLQKKREELVQRFQTDPECKMFLTTNAGSVGLNLQAANTVINVDLPWNPAVLEQRIARAHRMGQKQPVQVFVLVTEQTIEENLLATIAAKKDLALAALDVESEVDEVELQSGMEELKKRLEILLGSRPEAPIKEAMREQVGEDSAAIEKARRERVSAAGGELFGAAFKLLGELVSPSASPPPEALVNSLRTGLEACVEGDEKPRLTITLPDRATLEQLTQSLARLLSVATAGAGNSPVI